MIEKDIVKSKRMLVIFGTIFFSGFLVTDIMIKNCYLSIVWLILWTLFFKLKLILIIKKKYRGEFLYFLSVDDYDSAKWLMKKGLDFKFVFTIHAFEHLTMWANGFYDGLCLKTFVTTPYFWVWLKNGKEFADNFFHPNEFVAFDDDKFFIGNSCAIVELNSNITQTYHDIKGYCNSKIQKREYFKLANLTMLIPSYLCQIDQISFFEKLKIFENIDKTNKILRKSMLEKLHEQ